MALALESIGGLAGPLGAVAAAVGAVAADPVAGAVNSGALGGAALPLSATGAGGVPDSTSGAEGGAAAAFGFFLHPLKARAMERQTSAVILIIWRVPGGNIQNRAPVGRKMQG